MSSSRPLCVICERPAADGAVQAVHVDKEKLQTWFLNVCEEELAEEIEDDDLICFFCIWHAEFLAKHVTEFRTFAWWPTNLDRFYSEEARELRRNYLEGNAEQCWVQLETIESSESEAAEVEEPRASTSAQQQKRKKCFYCGTVVFSINKHMRKKHKDAIRCDYQNCATYFHSLEEKEMHFEEKHDKSKERKMVQCGFCAKKFTFHNYKKHVAEAHPEYSVRCDFRGCISFLKSKDDLESHFEVVHKKQDEAKVFKCHFCKYKTNSKTHLSDHISWKHLQKTIKCEKCDKMFATKQLLSKHMKQFHTYWVCTICSKDCVVQKRSIHLKRIKCQRCKIKFECSGVYQAHLVTCKESQFQCDQCPKKFQFQSKLDYHVKRKHGPWRGLKYKMLGFKC